MFRSLVDDEDGIESEREDHRVEDQNRSPANNERSESALSPEERMCETHKTATTAFARPSGPAAIQPERLTIDPSMGGIRRAATRSEGMSFHWQASIVKG